MIHICLTRERYVRSPPCRPWEDSALRVERSSEPVPSSEQNAALVVDERTRLTFGCGGIAIGVIQNGIAYFLLIYYSQVLGLSPSLAGMALAIALLFDALSDPLVGFLSDNWKSKWGRRHPFLYLSVLPMAAFFYLLWNPPAGLSESSLFVFLIVCTIGLRQSITLFDIPSNSLVPELTSDYDERTRLLTYKTSGAWIFGLMMTVAMYTVWLVPSEEQPIGVLNEVGYREGGLVGAVIILLSSFCCAAGLHRFIPKLHAVETSPRSLRLFLGQGRQALLQPSLRALVFSSAFSYLSSGMTNALWVYLYSFFWELTNTQISSILVANLIGAVAAQIVFPRLARKREKRAVALSVAGALLVTSAAPIVLRLIGLFPANGTRELYVLLWIHGVVQVALVVMVTSIFLSMTADIVEQTQLASKSRNEGIILATQTFTQKLAAAGGAALAGLSLSLIAFPQGDGLEELAPSIVLRLGLAYLFGAAVLYCFSIACIALYRVDRERHQQAVRVLEATE